MIRLKLKPAREIPDNRPCQRRWAWAKRILKKIVGFKIRIFKSVYAESRVKPAYRAQFLPYPPALIISIAMQFNVKTFTIKSVAFVKCLAMQSIVQTLINTQCNQCRSLSMIGLLQKTGSMTWSINNKTSPTRPLSWTNIMPRSSLSSQ